MNVLIVVMALVHQLNNEYLQHGLLGRTKLVPLAEQKEERIGWTLKLFHGWY